MLNNLLLLKIEKVWMLRKKRIMLNWNLNFTSKSNLDWNKNAKQSTLGDIVVNNIIVDFVFVIISNCKIPIIPIIVAPLSKYRFKKIILQILLEFFCRCCCCCGIPQSVNLLYRVKNIRSTYINCEYIALKCDR